MSAKGRPEMRITCPGGLQNCLIAIRPFVQSWQQMFSHDVGRARVRSGDSL